MICKEKIMSRTLESQQVFDNFRNKYNTPYSIADLTATVCTLCGVQAPSECASTPIPAVIDQGDKLMDGVGKTQKVMLFCADAMGEHQRKHYPEVFAQIEKCAGLRFLSTSVMPSVTPVCYGSIFTGAAPCVHGIEKYEKPVIAIETLFDAFAAAGKNVAICAVNGCSIDRIFRDRQIDYYSFRNDDGSFNCAMELMKKDYDLIVCYMIGYDYTMHRTGPFSEQCALEAQKAADRFQTLAEAMDEHWKRFNRALVFVPDHGGHNADERHGTHGTDMPEDMLVNHYYRICEAEV